MLFLFGKRFIYTIFGFWVLFVHIFVILGTRLGCLFEILLVSWGRPVLLWTSLLELLLLHPIDFVKSCFHLLCVSRYFLFLWFHCWLFFFFLSSTCQVTPNSQWVMTAKVYFSFALCVHYGSVASALLMFSSLWDQGWWYRSVYGAVPSSWQREKGRTTWQKLLHGNLLSSHSTGERKPCSQPNGMGVYNLPNGRSHMKYPLERAIEYFEQNTIVGTIHTDH